MIYWPGAVKHVTDLKNTGSLPVTGKTPCIALFGEPSPNLPYIKPFGCRVLQHPNIEQLN